jgi:microcystin degradation protein MlrC
VFVQEGPAGRGLVSDIGPTAVIRFGGLDVVVCHWMASSGDPQLYRAFGVEPTLYDLVVVKACTSFRAGYSKFSTRILETDTPGAATADLTKLHYKKIPNTHYPWTDSDTPECGRILFCRG